MKLQELLTARTRRDFTVPAMDPLREDDALQEAQVLDVRVISALGVVGVLFELRTALQLRGSHAGLLVARGVRELTWSAPTRDTPLTAWAVGSSRPVLGRDFELTLSMWPSPGAQLVLRAESAEFLMGNIAGLESTPPNYSSSLEKVLRQLPDWQSDFAVQNRSFVAANL